MRIVNEASIIGIVGSYRIGGVIDSVITTVLDSARTSGARVEKVYLKHLDIGFCTNCRGCMQDPGATRRPCTVYNDDMEPLLARIDNSDAVVIGAPVNAGSANALTQRFVERCAGYYYWPWGARAAPRLRTEEKHHKAVLVSSSGSPAFMNTAWFGVGAIHTLKTFADVIGADVEDIIKVGMITQLEIELSDRTTRSAQRLGRRLAALRH
ncbi:MAG: FMN reductase [marine bacterium B5-7]|nr:MAG: FMN reductase [marine bacterium B5-7]